MASVFPTEPSSYKEILKRSLILYRESLPRVILLSTLFGIISFLPYFFTLIIGSDIFFHPKTGSLGSPKLWLLLIEFLGFFVLIALFWKIYCIAINRHEPLIEDFSVGLHKVIAVLVASLLVSLIILGVSLLLFGLQILLQEQHLLFHNKLLSVLLTVTVFVGQFVLMIYIATLFIFLVPLIAIEKYHILKAMERSITLGWNYWWRTFRLQIVPWVIFVLAAVVVRYLTFRMIDFFNLQQAPLLLTSTIIYFVLFVIFMPWAAALLLVQLKDLEVRKKLQPV